MEPRNLIILLFFILVAADSATAQQHIELSYTQDRDNGTAKLIIEGRSEFPVSAFPLTITAMRGSSASPVSPAAPVLTIPITSGPSNITGAISTLKIDFGPGGPLTDDISALIVEGVATPLASTDVGPPVAVHQKIRIDMDFARKVRKLFEINSGPLGVTPILSSGSITCLDNSILIRVNSNGAVRVKATAATNVSPGSIVAQSDEKEILSNGSETLRISGLQSNTAYQVNVVETGPHPGRGGAQLTIVQDTAGNPLKTIQKIPTPSVSTMSADPKVINNKTIKISLQVVDSARIRLVLVAKKLIGGDEKVEAPVIQVLASPSSSPTLVDGVFALKSGSLDPQSKYQLQIQGLTQFDDVDPGAVVLSNPFSGLPPIVAKGIDFEFTSTGIRFAADTGGVAAKLEVKVGAGITNFSWNTSTSGGNPTFILPYDTIKAALPAPATGTAPVLPLSIGVQAQDDSGRTQSIAINLKIDLSEINAKPSTSKSKLRDFVTQIQSEPSINPGSGNSIKVGDIIKTGLSFLFRFLVPIP